MHRSGTSAITHGLQALGVSLGDNLYPPSIDNPKGFWEDRDCIRINEELLRHVGSTYDQLDVAWEFPRFDHAVSDLSIRAAEILKSQTQKSGGIWGFKDPRTCRLLGFWRPILDAAGYEVSFLVAIRNPISVARSLERRDRTAVEKGYLLWLQHVVPAVLGTDGSRRLVVDYDLLMDRPLSELQRMAQWLGLPLDDEGPLATNFVNCFLESSLRHTRFSPSELSLNSRAPGPVVSCYRLLLDAANDLASIDSDEIRNHFVTVNSLLSELAAVFSYTNKLEVQRRAVDEALTDQTQKLTVTEQALRVAEGHAAEQHRRAEAAEQQAAEQHRRAEAAEQQAAEQHRRAEAAEQQAAEQHRRAEAAEQQAAEQHRRAEAAEQQAAEQHRRAEAAEQQAAEQHRRAEAAEQQAAEQHRRAEAAEQQAAEQHRRRAEAAEERAEAAEQIAAAQHGRADVAERDAKDQSARFETISHQLGEALGRLEAIEESTSWRALAPFRSMLRSRPKTARLIRRSAKLLWWTITLQLPKRLWGLRRYRTTNATNIAAAAARLDERLELSPNALELGA